MRSPVRRRLLVAVAVVALVAAAVIVGVLVQRDRVADAPAAERWAREVAEDPDDVGARIQLGYAYHVAGASKRALGQYDEALKREPRNTAAIFGRAVVLSEIGQGKRAEEGFWDVLEIEPDHVQAAVQLGRYYASKDQFRSVLAAVRPVVEVRPESAELQYLTGLAYENLDRPDWAKARYKLALKASPDMIEARQGLERLGGGK